MPFCTAFPCLRLIEGSPRAGEAAVLLKPGEEVFLPVLQPTVVGMNQESDVADAAEGVLLEQSTGSLVVKTDALPHPFLARTRRGAVASEGRPCPHRARARRGSRGRPRRRGLRTGGQGRRRCAGARREAVVGLASWRNVRGAVQTPSYSRTFRLGQLHHNVGLLPRVPWRRIEGSFGDCSLCVSEVSYSDAHHQPWGLAMTPTSSRNVSGNWLRRR